MLVVAVEDIPHSREKRVKAVWPVGVVSHTHIRKRRSRRQKQKEELSRYEGLFLLALPGWTLVSTHYTESALFKWIETSDLIWLYMCLLFHRKLRERLKQSGWQLLAKDHLVVVELEEEGELAKINHSKMEDKRRGEEEEEVGGATEGRGLVVGRNIMLPQEAANHRSPRDLQLTTTISITIITIIMAGGRVAREPSQRHR